MSSAQTAVCPLSSPSSTACPIGHHGLCVHGRAKSHCGRPDHANEEVFAVCGSPHRRQHTYVMLNNSVSIEEVSPMSVLNQHFHCKVMCVFIYPFFFFFFNLKLIILYSFSNIFIAFILIKCLFE